MKRLIASRKLKITCIYCNKEFNKGDIYYKDRHVMTEFVHEIWRYIPGEAVKQPDHYECYLCGNWV